MAIYTNLKPENNVLNNVYLSYSFWLSGQVNVIKVEQDSDNITDLDFAFKIIADDGFSINYDNCYFDLDLRELKESDLKNLTEPTENDLLKIDLKDFETAEKIGEFETELDLDRWDCNFKNVDVTNFKTIEKIVNDVKYYIVLLDPKETSCMIVVYKDKNRGGSKFSIDGNGKLEISLMKSFFNEYGFESDDTFFIIHKINFNGKIKGEEPDKPLSKNIFTTYVVNPNILSGIIGKQEIYTDIIINTLSYPIKFKDADLTEASIKIGGIETSSKGKIFTKNIIPIEIFKFTIPKFNNVDKCVVNLPFNNSINLNYEDIENKTIIGTIFFEVLTMSTSLIINNGEYNIYKGKFNIESDLPYKPSGDYANYKKTETRLVNELPLLIITCTQIIKQDEIIKGTIKSEIKGILKTELELLNMLTEKGVLING